MTEVALFYHFEFSQSADPSKVELSLKRLRSRALDLLSYLAELSPLLPAQVSPGSAFALDNTSCAPYSSSDRVFHAIDVASENLHGWAERYLQSGRDDHASYSLLRSAIESLSTAIWLLGPEDTTQRAGRVLQLKATEFKDLEFYVRKLAKLDPHSDSAMRSHWRKVLEGERALLRQAFGRLGLPSDSATKSPMASFSLISSEAGLYTKNLRPAEVYSVWSVCSALVHGQPFYGVQLSDSEVFIGYDGNVHHQSRPSPEIMLRLVDTTWELLVTAMDLLNIRLSTTHDGQT